MTKPALDFDRAAPGDETQVQAYEHCKGNTAVELWTMNGVSHIPGAVPSWALAWDFLAAHPK